MKLRLDLKMSLKSETPPKLLKALPVVDEDVNDNDDLEFCDFQIFREHDEQSERFRKTLYYGKLPKYTDRPSLALTSFALEFIRRCLPPRDELRYLDMEYASKVMMNACVTPCSVVVALMYADRLRTANPQYLAKTNSCDLFLVSMMVASKFLYDDGAEDEVYNSDWAKAADIELATLNAEERKFLQAIDWNLVIRPPQFGTVLQDIERRIALKEIGKRKGSLTYTDISVLSSNTKVMDNVLALMYHQMIKVITVSMVGYCACVLTVAASVATLGVLNLFPLVLRTSQVPNTSSSTCCPSATNQTTNPRDWQNTQGLSTRVCGDISDSDAAADLVCAHLNELAVVLRESETLPSIIAKTSETRRNVSKEQCLPGLATCSLSSYLVDVALHSGALDTDSGGGLLSMMDSHLHNHLGNRFQKSSTSLLANSVISSPVIYL